MATRKQTIAAKPTKPSPPSKGKAKQEDTPQEAALEAPSNEAAAASPAHLNIALQRKVDQVLKFVESLAPSNCDNDDNGLCSVPELTLIGALMRMRVYYEVGWQEEASIADAENVIIGFSQRSISSGPPLPWVTIDTRKRSNLEKLIFDKIHGHGLDHVNLLQTEGDMMKKEITEKTSKFIPWDPSIVQERTTEVPMPAWHPGLSKLIFEEIWRKTEGPEASASNREDSVLVHAAVPGTDTSNHASKAKPQTRTED